MSLTQGAVGSNNYSASSRFIDGEGKLYYNKKRFDTPLITFLGMMGRKYEELEGEDFGGMTAVKVKGQALAKRMVENAKYTMFTDEQQEYSTQINNGAGYSSSATSIVVDDGSLFTPNDTLFVPRTGEMMLVSARSSNTLTVTRAVGSTGVALLDNDHVVNLSSAFPVNALSGTSKATIPSEAFNYTQIFRTPVTIGRTDKDSRLNYTNQGDLPRLIMEAGLRHLQNQERAFWYGRRDEIAAIDSSGTRQRTTGGVFQWVTSNVMDLSGSGGILTQPGLDAFAELAFQKGGSRKIAFCAPRVLSKINSLYSNLVRITPQESEVGLNVSRVETAHGILDLVRCQHFADSGLSSEYASYMVVLDPEQVKYAHLKNAENEYRPNIQENDRDGYKGEWLAEAGFQLTNETSHAILKGVLA